MIKSIDYIHYKLVTNLGNDTLKSIKNIKIAYQDFDMNPFYNIECDEWLNRVCNAFTYVFTIEENDFKTVIDIGLTKPIINSLFVNHMSFFKGKKDTPT